MTTKWPKQISALTPEQSRIRDDFVLHWHQVLPQKYGVIEKFNHSYSLKDRGKESKIRTLEIGAGLGEHLAYEDLRDQEYYCLELRNNMGEPLKKRFPNVRVEIGDCQERLKFLDHFFDRILAIHVLEHLPNLPAALNELYRVLHPSGLLSIVIPCDPGIAYSFARSISAKRIFEKKYKIPYDDIIRCEHLNSPGEIKAEIEKIGFKLVRKRFFPFYVPSINMNLCLGMTYKKSI